MPAILIKFKTEDGQEWTITDFASAHNIAAFTVRNRWVRIGRPSELKYSDLLKAPGHGGQNALRITVILRDYSERVCSAKEMGRLVDEAQGYHSDVVSHYDRWVRMGRPNPVHLDRLVQRKKAREKNDLSHVPDGDLSSLSGRIDPNREARLSVIPGPSRYEKAHFDNAGRFGGGTVQRDNFAGFNGAGFPVYTGGI